MVSAIFRVTALVKFVVQTYLGLLEPDPLAMDREIEGHAQ